MTQILIGLLFLSISITALNFTEKSESTGVVFVKLNRDRVSYDTFTITYHIEIDRFLQLTNKVKECIDKLEQLCGWIKPSNCHLIVKKLQDSLHYKTDDETSINAYRISLPSERSKRELIDFGGKVLNFISVSSMQIQLANI